MCRENLTRPSPTFLDTSPELIIHRIKGSPDSSRKSYPTKSKISRNVSGNHNLSNFKLRRLQTCRENFTRASRKFLDTSPELIIRRIKESPDVSRKFYPTKFKISRHVSGAHYSSNKGVSRRIKKILPDQVQNFSTLLKSL